jgi:nicotinamide-nucleotide amidase
MQLSRALGTRSAPPPVAIMPGVRATILAVGSELLSTERLDTNSLRLTALLERFGGELAKKSVVADLEPEIARELSALWETSDLVLVSGGLGPTGDDLTREAAARALGVELVEDPAAVEQIERRFAAMGRRFSPNNRKQAEILAGAVRLDNPNGTAPGQLFERDGKALFLFPGVPFELDRMAAEFLVPWLERRSGGATRETWTLKVAMRAESEVDQALAPVYAEFGQEWMTVLAGAGVRLLLTAVGPAEMRRERLAAMRERTLAVLGDGVFGEGAETTLESVVARLLGERGWTLATAESCTGGLVAERMTRVAGVSAVFAGGVVAYSNALKTSLLEVPPGLLESVGAVSEEVARAMAIGVCRRLGSDVGVSLTGIAGPGGGSAEKPVGTVHVAVAGPFSPPVEHRVARFPGSRERVRTFAAQMALEMLRRRLMEEAAPSGAGTSRTAP